MRTTKKTFTNYYEEYRDAINYLVFNSVAPKDQWDDLINELVIFLYEEAMPKVDKGIWKADTPYGYIKKALHHELNRLIYGGKKDNLNYRTELISLNDVAFDQTETMDLIPSDDNSLEEQVNYNELLESISKSLNEREYQLFELYFIDELNTVQISEILSISQQAVSKSIKKLRLKLQISLKDKYKMD